jgi:hypothetical protein
MAIEPLSKPAAENAVRADGTIFNEDAKQRVLATMSGGAEGEGVRIGGFCQLSRQQVSFSESLPFIRCRFAEGGSDAVSGVHLASDNGTL